MEYGLKRFRDWVKADVFKRMFDAVSDDPDMEYAMVDATIVRVHRYEQGAKGGLKARRVSWRLDDQNPGAADALGNLVRFVLLPGQRYDTIRVAPLIKSVEFGGLIADKAFDANWIIAELNERGAKIVIAQRPKRKAPLALDLDVYK